MLLKSSIVWITSLITRYLVTILLTIKIKVRRWYWRLLWPFFELTICQEFYFSQLLILWVQSVVRAESAIAYMTLGTGQLLIIFLIDGLCWLLVKWHIVLLSFFYRHEQDKQSDKNFENVLILKQNNVGGKSVAHTKLTFRFQHSTQLEFFLYLVRSPDYSFSPTFDTYPCNRPFEV